MQERSLPWCAVYSKSLDSDIRVLQVNTVCQERLNIVKVLGFQLGDGGKAIVILLDQLRHEILIEGQLMIPSDHHFKLIWQAACNTKKSQNQNCIYIYYITVIYIYYTFPKYQYMLSIIYHY